MKRLKTMQSKERKRMQIARIRTQGETAFKR